jgi:hypothetical protein
MKERREDQCSNRIEARDISSFGNWDQQKPSAFTPSEKAVGRTKMKLVSETRKDALSRVPAFSCRPIHLSHCLLSSTLVRYHQTRRSVRCQIEAKVLRIPTFSDLTSLQRKL